MATKRTARVPKTDAGSPIVTDKREIEQVMREIAKQNGPGTIGMANEQRQPWRISSGIFTFDLATLGGIPHNRLTMFHGPRSSGKTTAAEKVIAGAQASLPDQQCAFIDAEHCVAWDSAIMDVRTGQVYSAAEVFENRIPVTTAAFDETTKRLTETQITGWVDNGVKPLYKVSTGNTSVRLTGNHRVLVYAGRRKHEWIRADALTAGMLICRPRRVDSKWGEDTLPTRQARLIGYLLGDGGFSGAHGVTFFNIDPYGLQDVRELCAEMGVGMVQSKAALNAEYTYHLGTKVGSGENFGRWDRNPLRALINELGLSGLTSETKFIPERIMSGSVEAAGEVLSGLYMTDGCVNTARPSIAFSSTSAKMITQVRHLWARFGVVARVHTYKYQNPNHKDGHVVTVNGRKNLRVVDKVLRLGGKRHDQLQHWISGTDGGDRPTIGYYVPEYALTKQHIREKWATHYRNTMGVYWEMIEDVSLCGEEQTYDFSVAGLENLLVNDIVVHNSRDAVWGEKLGVDNEKLIHANPGTGEQAVDITDALIRTREISLVVLDSIAALVPMKEVTDSAEDAHVGLQSKLVAVMTRKITHALIEERKRGHFVTLLVINQQRDDIGGWSPTGKPIKLPGGRALEFTTSLQCAFKNKETISKDSDGLDTLEYNEHAFRLDKNKMNAGMRTGEYQLMRRDSTKFNLQEGDIDDAGTMLAHAKKIGCYTGGGKSWTLEFPDFKQTFGNADDTIEFLYDNIDIKWRLRCHLIADHAVRLKMPDYFVRYLYGDM